MNNTAFGVVLIQRALEMNFISDVNEVAPYGFKDFVSEFGRSYEVGSEDWKMREGIFNDNLGVLRAHNSKAEKTWVASVNKFMDYSPSEFQALMGYRKEMHMHGRVHPSLQQLGAVRSSHPAPPGGEHFVGNSSTATHVDWRTEGVQNSAQRAIRAFIRDQGACGSCWAVAAAGLMDFYASQGDAGRGFLLLGEENSNDTTPLVSTQSMVSCVKNPHHCGGKGGCQGATVQLAFAQIMREGQPLAPKYPYTSAGGQDTTCDDGLLQKWSRIFVRGYYQLEKNSFSNLIQACASSGPVGVSVAANSWSLYGGGIFDGAAEDFTVNHAVILYGYKTDGSDRHWIVKNSWGPDWGEEGFIRLKMYENEEEHCGWDLDAHAGIACDGDSPKDWVCGSSGILYDSSFPRDVYISEKGAAP